jgi:putative acetyltransferase
MPVTVAIETPLQDDVRELVALLNDHLLPLSPVEFQWKMTVEQMADAETTVFVARDEAGRAVGCGALKMADDGLAEVKRMFTRPDVRGQRVGSALLEAIEALARRNGVKTLMLETGTGPGFAGAFRLYENSGFTVRGAFFDYPDSEWSRFYEKSLQQPAVA